MATPTFLTEPEVAERLRCSTSKIKRLRLSGQMSYLPGRPVLIDEADLAEYLERVKRRQAAKLAAEQAEQARKASGTVGDPDPRRWALKAALKRSFRAKK